MFLSQDNKKRKGHTYHLHTCSLLHCQLPTPQRHICYNGPAHCCGPTFKADSDIHSQGSTVCGSRWCILPHVPRYHVIQSGHKSRVLPVYASLTCDHWQLLFFLPVVLSFLEYLCMCLTSICVSSLVSHPTLTFQNELNRLFFFNCWVLRALHIILC